MEAADQGDQIEEVEVRLAVKLVAAVDGAGAGLVLGVRLGVCLGGEGQDGEEEGAEREGGGGRGKGRGRGSSQVPSIAWGSCGGVEVAVRRDGSDMDTEGMERGSGALNTSRAVRGAAEAGHTPTRTCAEWGKCLGWRYVGKGAEVRVDDTGGWERFQEIEVGVVSARLPAALLRARQRSASRAVGGLGGFRREGGGGCEDDGKQKRPSEEGCKEGGGRGRGGGTESDESCLGGNGLGPVFWCVISFAHSFSPHLSQLPERRFQRSGIFLPCYAVAFWRRPVLCSRSRRVSRAETILWLKYCIYFVVDNQYIFCG